MNEETIRALMKEAVKEGEFDKTAKGAISTMAIGPSWGQMPKNVMPSAPGRYGAEWLSGNRFGINETPMPLLPGEKPNYQRLMLDALFGGRNY